MMWSTCGMMLIPGCGRSPDGDPASADGLARHSANALFEDIAERAGIRFAHSSGAVGKFYFAENTPAGCALVDYDNDGFADIVLVQSGPSGPPGTGAPRPTCALYHNAGDGTFRDVTAGSGLDRDLGYAQGVAAGDIDNDGYDDLFITSYGGNWLLHNDHGTGRFVEATSAWGLGAVHGAGYATTAAFGDYDSDGRLDLYVCHYCRWSWGQDKPCRDSDGRQDYCTPEVYEPETDRLYHNDGARFRDVSDEAGITRAQGRALSVVFLDYNDDGKQDIFVSNDLTPNALWRNGGDGAFTDVARDAGCARDGAGILLSGMGIGVADYDHSGHDSLFVGNFSDRPNMLYQNIGSGLFRDVSMASGLGMAHMQFLTFGCEFLDYDADGWPDLVNANGHVQMHAAERIGNETYRERKQLFHNEGGGKFKEVTDPDLMGDLMTPTLGRGLATGDFDNDGRVDILVNNQNGSAQLFRNLDRSGNHRISFIPRGTKSNRDGVHARFVLSAGAMRQTATVRGGSSYLSHSDRRVQFGLGNRPRADSVEIYWPSGRRELLRKVAADRIYIVEEGRGITATLARAMPDARAVGSHDGS